MTLVGVEHIYGSPTYSGGHFLPPADNTYDLGSAAHSWRNIYVDNLIYVTSTVMQGDFLPSVSDTYDIGSSTYRWQDAFIATLNMNEALTFQTTENIQASLTYSTDSTYLGGGHVTYSGGLTSSILKITGTHTNTTGGLHGIYSYITGSNDYATDGHGLVGIKSVILTTGTAVTHAEFQAGAFIAKKAGSGDAANSFILQGLEAWSYITGSGVTGTAIGGNIGYHADNTTADNSGSGTVWKGLQIFADNGTCANPAEETSALDVWGMAGTIDNAIKIGPSGGVTFTYGLHFIGNVGTVTTGIKFGGTAIGGAANVTMTTGIDMAEVTGMTDAIKIGAGKITHAYAMTATDENEEAHKLTITDASLASEDMHRGIVVDYTASGAKTGTAHIECFSADVTLTANTPQTAVYGAWVYQTGNPVLGYVIGMDIYFEDLGTNISNLMGMQITVNGTNAAGARHTPLRLTTVGGANTKAGLLMDVLGVYGLDMGGSTFSTADIRFQGGSTLTDDGTDLTLAGANLVLGSELTLGGTLNTGGHTLDAGSDTFLIATTDYNSWQIETTNAGADGIGMIYRSISSSPENNNMILQQHVQGLDSGANSITYLTFQVKAINVADGSEESQLLWNMADSGANLAMTLSGAGRLWVDADIDFSTSVDSAAVADHVSLGCFDEGGKRKLAISQEEPVVVEAIGASDRTLPVRINGTTYKFLLKA